MKDKTSVMIPQEKLEARIQEVADQINKDYAGKTVHLIGILKGSVMFLAELAKRLTVPVTMDFMSVSSYGDAMESSGIVRISKDTDEGIENKDVIIVEDIVDSGRTLSYLLELLQKRKPASLKLCTLLDKPSRRVVDIKADYTCFEVEDKFVIGFGLDYLQHYRNLSYIGCVEEIGDERE